MLSGIFLYLPSDQSRGAKCAMVYVTMMVFIIRLICKHYSNIPGDSKASPKGTEYGGLDAFPE